MHQLIYNNWEEIYVSNKFTIDVKQLDKFTFDHPTTLDQMVYKFGENIEFPLNPKGNKGFDIIWELENGPLDDYTLNDNKLVIQSSQWKWNQKNLISNMIVKGIIQNGDSKYVVQKEFNFKLIQELEIDDSLKD